MSTTRRTAGVYSRKRPLNEAGEKVCYNCGGLLPKGREFNCSPKCSEEWRIKTSPSVMRAAVFERDHGVCMLCKADTVALQAEYRKLIPRGMHSVKDGESPAEKFRIQYGVPIGRASGDWWDADHITPVIEGGGECGIENYRTLCIPCHVKATRELRARMKERRRQEKAVLKDSERGLFAGL